MPATTPATPLDPRAERGSLPLAMLLVIIFAGLMTVVVATTIAGQRSARFDRDFTQTVNGADAGAQEALFQLNAGSLDAQTLTTLPDPGQCDDSTLNGMDYRWCARALDPDGKQIEVTTTSELNGVSRTVVAEIGEIPAIPFVAFANTWADMGGNNQINSFDSSLPACAGGGWRCNWWLGAGIIASNDEVIISGASSGVDVVHLYDWANNPDWARCTQTGTGGGSSICSNPVPEPKMPRLDYQSDMLFMDEMFVGNPPSCPGGTYLQRWRTSVEGGAGTQPHAVGKLGPPPSGDHWCFDDFVLDRHTQTVNSAGSQLDLGDPPILVYVRNSVTVGQGGGKNINCPTWNSGCVSPSETATTALRPPLPTHLRVYSKSGDVTIQQQSRMAWILYAPNAACQGGAGVWLAGAMICQSISNGGGWSMWYDRALFNDGTGRYKIDSWREEPGIQVSGG